MTMAATMLFIVKGITQAICNTPEAGTKFRMDLFFAISWGMTDPDAMSLALP